VTETIQIATDLCLVHQMRNLNDMLDADVGDHIQDEEHAAVRRILRSWENRLQDALPSERRRRKDAGTKREPTLPGVSA
jgi:hypothetical protein